MWFIYTRVLSTRHQWIQNGWLGSDSIRDGPGAAWECPWALQACELPAARGTDMPVGTTQLLLPGRNPEEEHQGTKGCVFPDQFLAHT